MLEKELQKYCDGNIYTHEWYQLYVALQKYISEQNTSHVLLFCNKISLFNQGLYDNVGISDCFKYYLEKLDILLLTYKSEPKVLQEHLQSLMDETIIIK